MRFLIITQKVDSQDSNLGFFYNWILEFAKKFSSVIVLCREWSGEVVPANVKVIKFSGENRWSRVIGLNRQLWLLRNEFDLIFVHMIPEYVVAIWPIMLLIRKKIYLWYTHKAVGIWLKVAEKFVKKIFTASTESCRLISTKIVVVGHGIVIKPELFSTASRYQLITIGRISPIKNLETIIIAASELIKTEPQVKLKIVGPCLNQIDENYLAKLKVLVRQLSLEKYTEFISGVGTNKVTEYLLSSGIFLHSSLTGSLDKTPLEAMSLGIVALSSNEAVVSNLEKINKSLVFKKNDYRDLVEKIHYLWSLSDTDYQNLKINSKNYIENNHSLGSLVNKIIKQI